MSGCWPPAIRSAASTESTRSPHSGRWSPATRSAASTESTTRHPGAGPRLPAERSPPRSPHQPFRTLAPGNPQRGINRVHHTSPGRWPKATRRAESAKVTTPTLSGRWPKAPRRAESAKVTTPTLWPSSSHRAASAEVTTSNEAINLPDSRASLALYWWPSGRGCRPRGAKALLGRILYFCSTRSMAASAVPDFCSPDSHHRTSHRRASHRRSLGGRTTSSGALDQTYHRSGIILRSLLHACAQSA